MNPEVNNVIQLFLRWIHVVAGVIWIGHLYFFNWVNAHFAKTLDGPTKKVVIPELAPRALYWFRWGAAWTWLSGFLLAGLVYYHSRVVFDDPTDMSNNVWLWMAIFIVVIMVGFVVYNAITKAVKNVVVANTINLVLFAGAYLLFEHVGRFGGRSLYIHAGMLFGSMMAMNVWMVIWPAQRKIIAATKEGTAPDAALVAQAGLRSRHNTFMSVPLIFTMISNHYPTMYGGAYRDLCLLGVIVLGFAAVSWMYGKSAKVSGM